ncbi:MAG: class I SAM-dependent methyltransferase [Burkholderiales bacterium]|nr:class I SAM-dependent methyltransferase [Burkholderiales bacterium]
MQAYYAARAQEYDRVYAKPERQADLRAIEAWLPDALAGRTVLEVACGTGYWTQFLAPRCRAIHAFDATEETLAIARARRLPANVHFTSGDAYAITPPPEPCDGAFAGFWWSHVPRARLPAFLSGLHAALAPGARVIMLDNRYVAGSSTPVSAPDEAGDTWQERTLSDGSKHRVLKNFPSREALLQAVAACGHDARVREWPHYWALEYTTLAR